MCTVDFRQKLFLSLSLFLFHSYILCAQPIGICSKSIINPSCCTQCILSVCMLVSVWSTNKCHHRLLYSHKVFATASTNRRAVFSYFRSIRLYIKVFNSILQHLENDFYAQCMYIFAYNFRFRCICFYHFIWFFSDVILSI